MSLGAEERSLVGTDDPESLGVSWLDVLKLLGGFVVGARASSFNVANASARSPRQRRQMPLPSALPGRGNPQRGQRSVTGSGMMEGIHGRMSAASRAGAHRRAVTRPWPSPDISHRSGKRELFAS